MWYNWEIGQGLSQGCINFFESMCMSYTTKILKNESEG